MLLSCSTQYNQYNTIENMIEAASTLDKINSAPSRRLLVTHLPYKYLPEQLRNENGKIVYVQRNPKDLHVSMYNHLKGKGIMKEGTTWNEFIDKIFTGQLLVTCFLANVAHAAQCGCATDPLHVRSGAGTTHRILGTVPAGECHTDKGGRQTANGYTWANIDYNGQDAWAAINWLNFKTCQTHQSISSAGCPNIVSRAGWGARSPTQPHSLLTHTPNHVYIHHGASGGCHTKAACIDKVKAYQNYHMDGHHWSDIGYSFVVGEDGHVYEARGWDAVGAHTLHHNYDGLGICVIGNFMEHVPNDAALNVIKSLIQCGVNKGKITANYILKGHRDVGQTACPGQKLYDLIQTWPHYHH